MADVGLDVDQFAQTRGDDDLFDDEIIPISTTEMTTEVGEDVFAQQMEQMELQQQDTEPVASDMSAGPAPVAMNDIEREREGGSNGGYRSRGNARGNRRGKGDTERGRGGRGRRGGKNHPHAQTTQSSHTPPASQDQTQPQKNEGTGALEQGDGTTAAEEGQEAPSSTPEGPNGGDNDKEEAGESNGNEIEAGSSKVQSVRGDRSATGGIKKPKLTEEELSQKMAAAKLKAAERSAAHARAEADEALFQERERVAQEKRRAENQNRRVLESERERNRMRKLGAQTGREWDAEKKEEDYTQRNNRGSAFRRGAHGGVVDDRPPPPYSTGFGSHNDFDGNQQRGRGGRGRGRGGGYRGGRGGSHREGDYKHSDKAPDATQSRNPPAPAISAENEFPSLPEKATTGTTAPATSAISTGAVADTTVQQGSAKSPMTPLTPQGSWAEQVESSQKDMAKSDPPPYQPPEQAAT